MNGRRSSWTDSFRHAFEGVAYAIRHEPHMRFHTVAALLAAAAGICLRVPLGDWLWLGAAVSAVWSAELINTAVERTVDLVSPEAHPLAKTAKDTAAGAVLVAAAFAVAVGLIVLAPPMWRLVLG